MEISERANWGKPWGAKLWVYDNLDGLITVAGRTDNELIAPIMTAKLPRKVPLVGWLVASFLIQGFQKFL